MSAITKDKKEGEFEPFDQVRDYYKWVQGELNGKGRDIRWVKGALMLVDDLADAFDEGITTGNWTGISGMDESTIDLLGKLNVGIADYAIGRFNQLLYGEFSNSPLTRFMH